MAVKYIEQGIQIVTSFTLEKSAPLDSRTVVNLHSDLANIPALRKYEGMIIYVVEHKSNYQLIDNIWVKQVRPSDLATLGYGDMLKETYATTAKAGYVDKAILADKATNAVSAENSLKFAGKDLTAFATPEEVTKVAEDLKITNDTLNGIINGSSELPSASHSKTSDLATRSLSADVALKLKTPRAIKVDGNVISDTVNFDGSADVALSILLKDIITAGSGCKVTVNSKGLVTALNNLTVADIPTLSLAKISDAGTAASKTVGNGAGNIPLLDSTGKLNISTIPITALSETFVVDTEAKMLALPANRGDICVRSDITTTFILQNDIPTVVANWIQLKVPNTGVISVNGKQGVITLTTDNIAEGLNNLYYTDNRFNTSFTREIAKTTVASLSGGAKVLTTDDTFVINGGNASNI